MNVFFKLAVYSMLLYLLQARDALSAENSELLAKLAEANAKIHQLQSHIAVIRQHTIGFILEQMNTLSPAGTESGTEV